jgi:multidrug efflux pump subunit AcrA (membrane-fusion protein)
MANNKADIAAKIVVIVLIAIFLGLTAFNMAGDKLLALVSPAQGQQTQPVPGGRPVQASAVPAVGGAPGSAPPAATPASATTSARNTGGSAGGQAAPPPGGAAGAAGASGGARAPSAITVSVKRITPGTIRQIVRLNGDVTSRTEVAIFPDTSGKISRLRKSVGDTVAQGEIIGYVDPSRAGTYYVENPIAATVSGTIITLPVSLGETVATSTRIATIGSLSNLKITIYVAEKYSAYLSRGLPAVITFAATPGEEFTAQVTSVSPVVNSANRTIETDLALDSADPRIKPGMYANVDLVIREQRNTFVLPKGAVKNYNDASVVYVVDEDNVARRVTVTTGLSNDSEIEILTGIAEGDQVIIAGAVTDGSAVRIAAGAFE